MGKKINLSFKDNELENKLYEWLLKQSELIGPSTYIKQLILEDMQRKSTEKK
ncbi:hypothetical protein [Clostridium thermarum]|uniref:hypothetical protein n=1 Tax=Clostridium thermarum TaxID=1716543 RepID=UPI0013CF6B56|nr:hypothetical protein [Clostridium thermarum]